MKFSPFIALLAGSAAALVRAGEAEDRLKSAVTKLVDSPSYSWVSSTDVSGAPMRLSPTTGKTEKGGFTLLLTEAFGSEIQVVRKGTNAVVKTDEGWMNPGELPQPNFGGGGPPNMAAMLGRRLLSAKAPGEEADSLFRRLKPLKSEADGVSGEFTEEGAREFVKESRRGRGFAEPKSAKGSIRFWIKEGVVTKSELSLETEVETPQGSMALTSKTTTEIRDVGSTRVVVPDEAKKKLGL
jgi:hypothetical protein